MIRGPIIHGVLLVAALIFAYQTWTREEKTEPKVGTISMWSKAEGSLTALLFETKDRTVRVEKRTEGAQEYLWGKEVRVTRKKKRRPKPKPPADAGAEPAQPDEPEEEVTTTTREFPTGDKADEAWKYFTNMKALRDLGELDDEERKKYGVSESTDNITAVFKDGERSLILGGKIYGSQDRYVLDTETNRGYAVAGAVLRSINSGETSLRVKNLHKYKPDDVQQVKVATPAGAERNLVRLTVDGAKHATKTWADAKTPDKPDQTMANFLTEIDKVKPSRFYEDLDSKTLTHLLTIEYRDAKGAEIGRFEMYKEVEDPEPVEDAPEEVKKDPNDDEGKTPADAKKDPAATDAKKDPAATDEKKDPAAKDEKAKPEKKPNVDYYVRTERTRVLGKFGKRQGERLESDLAQIFEK